MHGPINRLLKILTDVSGKWASTNQTGTDTGLAMGKYCTGLLFRENHFMPNDLSDLWKLNFGGVDTRSGYVRYIPVISANVPCTYYAHRDI